MRVVQCAVITVSDRCAAGEREDRSGPVLAGALREAGHDVTGYLVPDGAESVGSALREALAAGALLIVTTGGTGVGPRDRTPEGTRAVLDRYAAGGGAYREVVYDNCGHSPHIERPADFTAELLALVNG
ncbi:MAG: molybdopterin-binding protein [Propionicimonas sp.]|nr:molybdopterin-binding protein [Propionicimonas sp.]